MSYHAASRLLRPLRGDRRIRGGQPIDIVRLTYCDWNFGFKLGKQASTPKRLNLGRPILTIFIQLGGPNRPKINQKSISETKMGAQGDQATPKAPKLKPNDAQSLPKGSPETSQDSKRAPKRPNKCDQKCSKNVENRVKKTTGIGNDVGDHIWSENLQIRAEFASPNLKKSL